MTNFTSEEMTLQEFCLADHAVEPEYFLNQVKHFEEKYQEQFPEGWNEFYVAYSLGITDKGILDYDEWAFLCQHFMRELTQSWQPPGEASQAQERPEANSGFSFEGRTSCSIHSNISGASKENSPAVRAGRTQAALS